MDQEQTPVQEWPEVERVSLCIERLADPPEALARYNAVSLPEPVRCPDGTPLL